jgi:hypothetical protein
MHRFSKILMVVWVAILLTSSLLLSSCVSTSTEIAASEPMGRLELSLPLAEATECARDSLEREFRDVLGRNFRVSERRFADKQESWVFASPLWMVKLKANSNSGTTAEVITTHANFTKMGDCEQIEKILVENCRGVSAKNK